MYISCCDPIFGTHRTNQHDHSTLTVCGGDTRQLPSPLSRPTTWPIRHHIPRLDQDDHRRNVVNTYSSYDYWYILRASASLHAVKTAAARATISASSATLYHQRLQLKRNYLPRQQQLPLQRPQQQHLHSQTTRGLPLGGGLSVELEDISPIFSTKILLWLKSPHSLDGDGQHHRLPSHKLPDQT